MDACRRFNKLDTAVVKAFKGATGDLVKTSDAWRRQGAKTAKEIDRLDKEMTDILTHAKKFGIAKYDDKKLAKKSLSKFKIEFESMSALGKQIRGRANSDLKNLKKKSLNTYRALKVLATGLELIATTNEYRAKTREQQIKEIGNDLSTAKREQGVYDRACLQLKKGLRKARACLQKIKSDPTLKTWNNAHNDGMFRDVRMAVRSLRDAQAKGKHLDFDTRDAEHYLVELSQWDGRAKAKLSKELSEELTEAKKMEIVLTRARKYSRLAKNIAETYKIVY